MNASHYDENSQSELQPVKRQGDVIVPNRILMLDQFSAGITHEMNQPFAVTANDADATHTLPSLGRFIQRSTLRHATKRIVR